jgi:hypothetical protein
MVLGLRLDGRSRRGGGSVGWGRGEFIRGVAGLQARKIHQAAKNLVAQAFQPVQKTLCFFGLLNLTKYIIALSSFLKSS